MSEKNVPEFKRACEEQLSAVSITMLRSYGRSLQLKAPTKLRKDLLIKEIIGVLCGEIVPQRNKKGAPAKNSYVAEKLIEKISELKKEYLLEDVKAEGKASPSNDVSLQLSINPSTLNENQKRLLNNFLNSL